MWSLSCHLSPGREVWAMGCFILIVFLFGWFCHCGSLFFWGRAELLFWFLTCRLLHPEVKGGRIEAWMLHLGWVGVKFLLRFAVDSTALCLPWRTSAFCLGELYLVVQGAPQGWPVAHAVCTVILESSQKGFSQEDAESQMDFGRQPPAQRFAFIPDFRAVF